MELLDQDVLIKQTSLELTDLALGTYLHWSLEKKQFKFKHGSAGEKTDLMGLVGSTK